MAVRHVLLVALFCFAIMSIAQTKKSNGIVKSFKTSCPDTIVQDVSFSIEYELTSKMWDKGGHPLQGNGFNLTNVVYTVIKNRPYSKLLARATYVCSSIGDLKTPGMVAVVNGDSLVSSSKPVHSKPNPKYGKEMDMAFRWLVEQGQNPDSLFLKVSFEGRHSWLFDDPINACFCLVAKRDVWPLLDNPILAYSKESSMNYKNDKGWCMSILDSYDKQIQELSKVSVKRNLLQEVRKDSVMPLLADLSWGQAGPYNRKAPTLDGKKALIGCVPLSIGMVMNYHKWPKQGRSHVYYQPDNRVFEVDFTSLSPLWDSYSSEYPEDDTSAVADDLSRLLVLLSFSLDANFTQDGTVAKLSNVKHVLCNNLNYSSKMNYYYKELKDSFLVSLLHNELSHKRPCILSNDSHAFVCDGYNGDFFHFNMGWGGFRNGYYKMRLGKYPQMEKSLLMVTGILCGIEPHFKDYTKEVAVVTPGTLETYFTEEEKSMVTKLIIKGEINSKDIIFIRQLAGAFSGDSLIGKRGTLKILDLENTIIGKDNNPYLVRKATGMWTRTSYTENSYGSRSDYDSRTYNFETMDEKTWKSFKMNIGSKQQDLFYTRTDDNKYYVHYKSQKNTIGRLMFSGCSSLESVVLPQKIEKIADYSFAGCISLQEITIPRKVSEIGEIPFDGCSSLEYIRLPLGKEYQKVLARGCSPSIQVVRYR